MAKELDWKSSKAATPRGFESHVLRQKTQKQAQSLLSDRRQTPDRLYDRPGLSFTFSFFSEFCQRIYIKWHF